MGHKEKTSAPLKLEVLCTTAVVRLSFYFLSHSLPCIAHVSGLMCGCQEFDVEISTRPVLQHFASFLSSALSLLLSLSLSLSLLLILCFSLSLSLLLSLSFIFCSFLSDLLVSTSSILRDFHEKSRRFRVCLSPSLSLFLSFFHFDLPC
jgi:hypothetical protein